MEDDKVFCGFLRLLISSLQDAIDEKDSERQQEKLQKITTDLQHTLED